MIARQRSPRHGVVGAAALLVVAGCGDGTTEPDLTETFEYTAFAPHLDDFTLEPFLHFASGAVRFSAIAPHLGNTETLRDVGVPVTI